MYLCSAFRIARIEPARTLELSAGRRIHLVMHVRVLSSLCRQISDDADDQLNPYWQVIILSTAGAGRALLGRGTLVGSWWARIPRSVISVSSVSSISSVGSKVASFPVPCSHTSLRRVVDCAAQRAISP